MSALLCLLSLAACHSPDAAPDASSPTDDAATAAPTDDAATAAPTDGAATMPPADAGPEDARPVGDATAPPRDADLAESKRVLFVGNSYTTSHDLPEVVSELAAASGVRLEPEVIASGGAKLCDHRRAADTRARIRSAAHDAVVIQGQSVDMFYDGESAYYCARDIAWDVRDAGMGLVWFATWARREGDEFYSRGRGVTTPAEMTDVVEGWYRGLSRYLGHSGPGGHVARVGHAWERALATVGGVELHAADGSHPSPVGTFVAACALTQPLIGSAPEVPSPPPLGLDAHLAETLCRAATEDPCFEDLQFCGGECLSVSFDPMHCGACGNACSGGRECWRGECECAPGFAMATSFESLARLDPTCEATAARPSQACAVAAHRACADVECGGSGFGPYTTDAGDLEVMCTSAEVVATTYSELGAHHAGCDGISERHGDACLTAAHRACVARGATAGLGPVSRLGGDEARIACLDDAEVLFIPDEALDAWGCEGYPDREWDEVCDQTVHELCTGMGKYGGYGPIEPSSGRTDGVDIVCVSR